MRITVIVTDEEYGKLKTAAGLVKLGPWVRHVALSEADGERAKPEVAEPATERGSQKNSTPGVEVGRTDLPRARPVKRRHVDVRDDVAVETVKAARCTYQPMGDRKCPRCGKVHSHV